MALSCWQRRAASSRWPPSSRWRYLPVRAAEAQTGRHWKTPGSLAHVRRFCDAPTTHDDAAIPAAGARRRAQHALKFGQSDGVVRLPPSAYRRSAPPATRERLRASEGARRTDSTVFGPLRRVLKWRCRQPRRPNWCAVEAGRCRCRGAGAARQSAARLGNFYEEPGQLARC